ncbi:MAG: hypothetical protein DWQ07_14005 [Chloroflexi bacterium]|nr:MAG: hypothetical protein DWQ07_14005 [Chloroflexota bacterium]
MRITTLRGWLREIEQLVNEDAEEPRVERHQHVSGISDEEIDRVLGEFINDEPLEGGPMLSAQTRIILGVGFIGVMISICLLTANMLAMMWLP